MSGQNGGGISFDQNMGGFNNMPTSPYGNPFSFGQYPGAYGGGYGGGYFQPSFGYHPQSQPTPAGDPNTNVNPNQLGQLPTGDYFPGSHGNGGMWGTPGPATGPYQWPGMGGGYTQPGGPNSAGPGPAGGYPQQQPPTNPSAPPTTPPPTTPPPNGSGPGSGLNVVPKSGALTPNPQGAGIDIAQLAAAQGTPNANPLRQQMDSQFGQGNVNNAINSWSINDLANLNAAQSAYGKVRTR